jgi:hypothetical protein
MFGIEVVGRIFSKLIKMYILQSGDKIEFSLCYHVTCSALTLCFGQCKWMEGHCREHPNVQFRSYWSVQICLLSHFETDIAQKNWKVLLTVIGTFDITNLRAVAGSLTGLCVCELYRFVHRNATKELPCFE